MSFSNASTAFGFVKPSFVKKSREVSSWTKTYFTVLYPESDFPVGKKAPWFGVTRALFSSLIIGLFRTRPYSFEMRESRHNAGCSIKNA